MMTRRTARLVGSSLCAAGVFLGRIALAGTPLPDPPFSSGGFVPPTKLALTQELNVAKLISKYAGLRARCDQNALLALQLAYEPANTGKVPSVQQKWTYCVQKADLAYLTLRDRLLLKGTPGCLDQTAIDAIRALVDAQLAILGPIVYCDADAAAPDPVTGLNIPDFKKEAEGEVSAAKAILKAGRYADRCYMKAVTLIFKRLGTLLPADLITIDACLAKVSAVATDSLLKLDQTQKLPACLSLATAQSVADNVVAAAGLFTAINYCASPSGAFVDG